MRRWFKNVALLLVSLMVLTACGGSSGSKASGNVDSLELPKGKPVEIEFWHIQATIYGEAVKEMVASFNKKYEGQIVVKEVFKGTYADLNKALRASIQGGGMPQVSMAYENETLEYILADVVVPLDPYIESSKYGLKKADLDDIIPGVLARQRIPEYKGKTMSWIHGNSSLGMYYNIDLLKKAGFDKPPKTWDEMPAFSKKVKEATGLPALVLNAVDPQYNWKAHIGTFNVFALQGDGSVKIDTPEALKALKAQLEMVKDGTAILGENTEQEFVNGRVAMEWGTTARTQTKIDLIQNKFKWGITLPPMGNAQVKPQTELYGGNHVMLKSDPQKQLASWIFMKYFGEAEAQAIYAAKTGYFPAVKAAMNSSLVKENYSKYPQKQQAFDEVSVHARIQPPHPAVNTMHAIMKDGLTAVFQNKLTPEQALKDMQAKVEKAVKDIGK